ncbi:Integral membrane protein sed5 [Diplonema papillatum]|nr:Integral membrane protein sed5 [Diplonema papillatum]
MVISRDRTNELHQVFEEVRKMQDAAGKPAVSSIPPKQLSQFHKAAQEVTRELTGTAEMLENLTKLVQQRNVFEDHSPEVNQITIMIKERIANLHQQLGLLAQIKDQNRQWGANQANSHSNTVVNSLRNQLFNTQKTFKDILTKRTKKLTSVNDRRSNFTSSLATYGQASSLFSQADNDDEEGMASAQLMQGSDNRSIQYYSRRQEGVKMIGKIVEELSEQFSDFTRIVAEQEEMVQRIDANTEEAYDSITQGQSYLLQHLKNISTNRSLIFSVFGILFFFVIVFGIFVVR